MPVAQQDQWQQDPASQDPASQDDGAIRRLESALRRIAAAAGRRQDELRVAELTARAAQHEAELLLQAQGERERDEREQGERDQAEALQRVDEHASQREEEMRELAARLDGLIAMVRAAIPDWEPGRPGPEPVGPELVGPELVESGSAASGSIVPGSTGPGSTGPGSTGPGSTVPGLAPAGRG